MPDRAGGMESLLTSKGNVPDKLLGIGENRTEEDSGTGGQDQTVHTLFFISAGVMGVVLVLLEVRPKRKTELSVVRLCPSCGTENPADAKYCMECGRKLR